MDNITINQTISNFNCVKSTYINEISATLHLFSHPSGAKLYYIENEDINKVFGVAFTTPATNHKGTFHIIEHSVLCGSEKYNLKEPFVNLLKSSMQTYLNAMTYPDRTLYPVATTCEKDLTNLMSVYLDGVWKPNMLTNKSVFLQEGWHYDLDGKFDISGVVYNEMKGSIDASDASDDALYAALFPNTPYGKNSGGLPSAIPSLSYDEFCGEYKKHYTPANSTFFLYGNVNLAEKLALIDSYLPTAYGERLLSPIGASTSSRVETKYDCGSEDELGNYYLTLGYCPIQQTDYAESIGIAIIDHALLDTNQSILKKAVLDSKLAADVISEWQGSMRQPVYSLRFKNMKAEDEQQLITLVRDTIADTVKNGLPKTQMLASLKNLEFTLLENDSGNNSIGIYHFLKIAGCETYGSDPIARFSTDNVIKFLYEKLETDWFEKLLEKVFNAEHNATVLAVPCVGYTNEVDDKAATQAKATYDSLSDEQKNDIASDLALFNAWQAGSDSAEAMQAIPSLSLSDLDEQMPIPAVVESYDCGIRTIYRHMDTHITYASVYFNLNCLDETELGVFSMLAGLISELPTTEHTVQELETRTHANLGFWSTSLTVADISTNGDKADNAKYNAVLGVNFSCKPNGLSIGFDITQERLQKLVYDSETISRAVKQRLIAGKTSFASSGHITAISGLKMALTDSGMVSYYLNGYGSYNTIKRFEEDTDALISIMKVCADKVFRQSNAFVTVTSKQPPTATIQLSDKAKCDDILFTKERKNVGYLVTGNLNYVGMGGRVPNCDRKTAAQLTVASQILELGYLWNEVRAKGGAYGCGMIVTRFGVVMFYSYRDGQTTNTLDVYRNAGKFLKELDLSGDEFKGHIISIISNSDKPCSVRMSAIKYDSLLLSGVTNDDIVATRNFILNATLDDVKAAGTVLENVLAEPVYSVTFVGDEKITKLVDEVIDMR